MTFDDVIDEALCEIWMGRRFPPWGCYCIGGQPVTDITARMVARERWGRSLLRVAGIR